jgi:hypothetical protein
MVGRIVAALVEIQEPDSRIIKTPYPFFRIIRAAITYDNYFKVLRQGPSKAYLMKSIKRYSLSLAF